MPDLPKMSTARAIDVTTPKVITDEDGLHVGDAIF